MGFQGSQNCSWLHTRPHCTNTAFDGGGNGGSGHIPQAASKGLILLHFPGYTGSHPAHQPASQQRCNK